MKKEFEIITQLSKAQRQEFDKDLQALYLQCHNALNGKLEKLKDVTASINLLDQVFLKVTFEYDNTIKDTVKGKITALKKYNNKEEYLVALARDKVSLN
ncbi:hypothetical protein WH52_09455 [Tenacibaculum holothuriorum]|uniref:Uncharacterized protein n=1 Tax=Tenacibaculum holothuriorum TaxID=1635173 RepID=A0A1Y2PB10_9FLAO|nr:hypothetical protein [Tenacibaculum holothuriorum]OSY87656.1 hypothetical protein WH52_09455 [Tenacibaculum holothuriorum]